MLLILLPYQQLPMEDCIQILKQETRGVLSVLGDDDYPYGMPMNHWYNEEDGKIYFHCGKTGHRLDALKNLIKYPSAHMTTAAETMANGLYM